MSNFLTKIRRLKKEEVADRKREIPLTELHSRIRDLPPARDFRGALNKTRIALIAEVKKSSPSAGVIAEEIDPGIIAMRYQEGGAAAVSVLTESRYFSGEIGHLKIVKEAVSIPVLRKDFIIDEYQIYESRVAGADAILLISELIDRERLETFLALSHQLGLACLVESHSRDELEKAIASGATILGINNRNLETLKVDLKTSIRLLPLIPRDRIRVAESGIKSTDDVRRLAGAGANAILVGEVLVRSEDPVQKIKELIA